MVSKIIYITPEGQRKLEKELEYLCTVRRREVAQRLHEATEDGEDLEENVAYEVAKNEQAFLEWRIREIEEKLARTRLVELGGPENEIRIGSKVVVQEEGGELETFIIVSTAEASPRDGLISYESPLGQALLGRQEEDEILVNAPSGTLRFRVVTID
jgi:transcription elongation factor GreA